jgi:hypothetical protein
MCKYVVPKPIIFHQTCTFVLFYKQNMLLQCVGGWVGGDVLKSIIDLILQFEHNS